MKTRFVPVFWMVLGAVTLLPLAADAQAFSSTQAPGGNPFSRSAAPLPINTPPPRAIANQPPGYASGSVPTALAVTGPIDPDHKLGPRDGLSYSVAEDRDDRVYQLVVTDSGEVELPLGSMRVKAAGKTTSQLTSDIRSALEREYYKPGHATVRLGLTYTAPNASKGKVYLTGEIVGHGAVDLPADGQLTAVQAILQTGGFTIDSNLKEVYILRKGAPKDGIPVNAKAVLNGDSDKDVVLQPNDTIKVKKKLIGVSL